MIRVLIADDEPQIRGYILDFLSDKFVVFGAADGKEAFEMALQLEPDVIVLDVVMPRESGLETSRRLRADSRTRHIPIIMLTGLNEPEQRIKAFGAGADDYLAKPFHPEELVARIQAKAERMRELRGAVGQGTRFKLGELEIDLPELKARVSGLDLHLSGIEFKLLNLLARHADQLVAREKIEKFIWGDEKPSIRALDPHIASLRKKLKNTGLKLRTSYKNGFALETRSGSRQMVESQLK